MPIETISADQYAIERAICDKAHAFWKANATYSKGGWSSLSSELAKHPDYAACTNEMRGRVEQYEILRDLPEKLVAYIGRPSANIRQPRVSSSDATRFVVTVWTGQPIGFATRGAGWRVHSHIGSHMYQFYARIGGREYTGRGFGEGMAIVLRETAESKRNRSQAIAAEFN